MDLWNALPWSNMGAGVIVAAGVIAMIRGLLMPRSTVERLIDGYEARLKDRDEQIKELKTRAAMVDARNDLLVEQVRQLMEVGRTTNAVLTSLPVAKG